MVPGPGLLCRGGRRDHAAQRDAFIPPHEEWRLVGNIVGARDFSPDYVHRDFGTSVSELTLYAVTGKSRAPMATNINSSSPFPPA